MPITPKHIEDAINIAALIAYSSSGLGQAMAVPGVIISGITFGIFKSKANKHQNTDPEKAEQYRQKMTSAKRRALGLALGAIPVAGAFIAIYAVERLIPKKKEAQLPTWARDSASSSESDDDSDY